MARTVLSWYRTALKGLMMLEDRIIIIIHRIKINIKHKERKSWLLVSYFIHTVCAFFFIACR